MKNLSISDNNGIVFPQFGEFETLFALFNRLIETTLNFWTRQEIINHQRGGFNLWFDENGLPMPPDKDFCGISLINHMRVLHMQARFSAAHPDDIQARERFEHGFDFIDRFIAQDGNYHDWLQLDGKPFPDGKTPGLMLNNKGSIATIYVMYICSENALMLNHAPSLAKAEECFQILENNAWDREFGGYFNTTVEQTRTDFTKNMGQNMHGALALSRLYSAKPDNMVLARTKCLYEHLSRDYFTEFLACDDLTRNWQKPTPVPERVMLGHFAELVWYLEDVTRVTGQPYADELTGFGRAIASKASPHGFLNPYISYDGTPLPMKNIIWWTQMEMMILLARMYRRTGEEQFLQQFWQTAENNCKLLVNQNNLVWYGGMEIATGKHFPQGGWAWKGGLHVVRSLTKCFETLQSCL